MGACAPRGGSSGPGGGSGGPGGDSGVPGGGSGAILEVTGRQAAPTQADPTVPSLIIRTL